MAAYNRLFFWMIAMPTSAQILPPPAFEQKLCSRAELAARVASLPKPVVMTNGVFDILHRGHVTYLAQARALGASLVVALNTDASVKRLGKGEERPINALADRMALLAALESVSLVVEFGEDTALEVVQAAHPEIYVKGGDYQMDQIPEGKAVLGWGGQALAIHFEHDRSTTGLLEKLRK
jgi:rfaE bifunctional protein nucleotidyltransferase chain/domain